MLLSVHLQVCNTLAFADTLRGLHELAPGAISFAASQVLGVFRNIWGP